MKYSILSIPEDYYDLAKAGNGYKRDKEQY